MNKFFRMTNLEEIGNTKWIDSFSFSLYSSQTYFLRKFQQPTSQISTLLSQRNPIEKIKENLQTNRDPICDTSLQQIQRLESHLETLKVKPEDWEEESLKQLAFTEEWSKPFNGIPYVLPITAYYKSFIVPFFAVLIPLVSWILPYIVVRLFFHIPMTFQTYMNMMIGLWLGSDLESFSWSSLELWKQMKYLFQGGWFVFGLYQAISQPLQQSAHVRKLDKQIVEKGIELRSCFLAIEEFLARVGILRGKEIPCPYLAPILEITEPRELYIQCRENQKDIQWILQAVAQGEVEYKLAIHEDLCFVDYKQTNFPYLKLKEFYDPSISKEKRVKSNLRMVNAETQHVLLTGPNQGGKSSILRALYVNCLLAQTFGIAFATSMKLRPFDWIETGLRLADRPGEVSLFERELEFASHVLQKTKQKKKIGLLLYDEAFHSTNPPDGEKTARIFMRSLWECPNVMTFISTHVFSLVETAPNTIKRMCVPAYKVEDGIEYTFQLRPGLCKVSSVEELYKKQKFPMYAVDLRG